MSIIISQKNQWVSKCNKEYSNLGSWTAYCG